MAEIAALPWNGFKVASTFSGCGGSSLGYKLAGFKVVWANEFIPAAQETYRANHPTTILDTRDIRTVMPNEILAATGLKRGELDLFDGSPPCSSFSTAGLREKGWGRVKKYSDSEQRTDDLFFEYIRLLEGLQPKVFVAENVKGLTMGAAADLLGTPQLDMFDDQEATIYHRLCAAGYVVRWEVLNASDLGVPQSRQRVIFIGVRRDLAIKFDIAPSFPRRLPYRYTVRDACPWIEAPKHMAIMTLNPFTVEPETDISRYAVGAEWDKLAVGEQSEKYFSEVKVDPELPCPTVCASQGTGSIAAIVHPFEKRKFSIAEIRRLCAFPDDFALTGDYVQQWERLGRAVPPVMMGAIAANVRDSILIPIYNSVPIYVSKEDPNLHNFPDWPGKRVSAVLEGISDLPDQTPVDEKPAEILQATRGQIPSPGDWKVFDQAQITAAVNASCECGGKPPGPDCCAACNVFHFLFSS